MKSLTIIIMLSINALMARGQVAGGAFQPPNGGTAYVPAGTEVVYSTIALVDIQGRGNVDQASFTFGSLPQATVIPAGFTAYRGQTTCNVQIKIQSDTPECYSGFGIMAIEVGNSSWGFFYSFGPVVFYNPHIIGHANAYSNYFSDSVSFSNTLVNNSAWLSFHVVLDSLGQYRSFRVLNVRPPFRIDSIFLQYQCSSFGSNPNIAWFSPTKPGHYIHTVYLLDPLTNDSLPLILIGDAYDAGVTENAAQQLELFPNPCDRSIAISLRGEEIELVAVQNILGEHVFEERQEPSSLINMNTSALLSGIYYVEVRSHQSRYWRRIIVTH